MPTFYEMQDHEKALKAIGETEKLLWKSDLAAIEKLNTLAADLIAGVRYETKHRNGSGKVIDFVIEKLPKLKTKAREFYHTKAGRLLIVACSNLIGELPPGCTIDPAPPIIDGGYTFRKAVREVVSKLPHSVKKRLAGVCFIELDPGQVKGFTAFPNTQAITIHSGLDDADLKRTIAHEIAHVYFEHHLLANMGPEIKQRIEQQAESQAIAWGW